MVRFTCARCEHESHIPAALRGKAIYCENCNTRVPVPLDAPLANEQTVRLKAPETRSDTKTHSQPALPTSTSLEALMDDCKPSPQDPFEPEKSASWPGPVKVVTVGASFAFLLLVVSNIVSAIFTSGIFSSGKYLSNSPSAMVQMVARARQATDKGSDGTEVLRPKDPQKDVWLVVALQNISEEDFEKASGEDISVSVKNEDWHPQIRTMVTVTANGEKRERIVLLFVIPSEMREFELTFGDYPVQKLKAPRRVLQEVDVDKLLRAVDLDKL